MINRRTFSAGLLAGAATTLLATSSGAQTSPKIRNVVLVHGAYADGSSWLDVIPLLQKAGLKVTAAQHPLLSLADDTAAVRRILAQQDGPTVLVAHSFGGTLITETGLDPNVAALVYIAARAPDVGEDFAALGAGFPKPPVASGIVRAADGFLRLSEEAFLKDFAGDVAPDKARALYAVQGQVSPALFTDRTTVAAWKTKPSFYAVSKNDHTINPDLQRFMAARMKAQTVELEASHVSLVSRPKDVAQLILTAAGAA